MHETNNHIASPFILITARVGLFGIKMAKCLQVTSCFKFINFFDAFVKSVFCDSLALEANTEQNNPFTQF